MASLQSLATEVSAAYGIKRPSPAESGLDGDPGWQASAEQFHLLLRASYTPLPLRHEFLDVRSAVALPMDWPVEGRIVSSFGDRLDPFNGEGAFHAGIDISQSYGAPVRAAANGMVISAAREAGYGLAIMLDHGRGVRTFYAHLSGFNVAAGQAVLGGEVLGFVGRSGRSTGSHLHYEVRIQNAPVNPIRFLDRAVNVARFLGD